jgi:hypothetical protein
MTYQEKGKKKSQFLLKTKSWKVLFLLRMLFAEFDDFDDIITEDDDDSDDDAYLPQASDNRVRFNGILEIIVRMLCLMPRKSPLSNGLLHP